MPAYVPPLNASTVLAWLPLGEVPTDGTFDIVEVRPPPSPNPHGWWMLSEAIEYTSEILASGQNVGKEPWIKTGDVLFDPEDVRTLCGAIPNVREQAAETDTAEAPGTAPSDWSADQG